MKKAKAKGTQKSLLSLAEVARAIDARAPTESAESWDNVGLLVGSRVSETRGAVVSIDLTQESIDEAKKRGYKLIVTHHPCIFPKSRGLARVTDSSSPLVYAAIEAGIGVIASHTCFDRCAPEVTQAIAAGLGLRVRGRLHGDGEGLLKLVAFVPTDHVEKVRDALHLAGAGQIGHYDRCSFGVEGEGTFRGDDSTRPFIGKPGREERVQEVRLETVIPKSLEKSIVKAMLGAHPYEEVAYDLYPLAGAGHSEGWVKGLGYGFWGEWDTARSFPELERSVKSLFEVDGFWLTPRFSKPTSDRIRRVGFVAGKGADFLRSARAVGCDVFVTGEAGYHTALGAARDGVSVIELGHRESERFFLKTMVSWLQEMGLEAVELNSPTQKICAGAQAGGRK